MKTHIEATAALPDRNATKERPRYRRPRLVRLGDLRGSTFGPSPGTGESGGGGTFDFMFTPFEDYDQLP